MSDLQSFRRAIVALSRERAGQAIAQAIVVPTAGAERQLRRSIGDDPPVAIVTRDGLYDELHARLDTRPRRLTAYERDVIAQAAVRSAGRTRARPGFISEVLRFYDQLRRQNGSVDRFEELLEEALSRDADFDRGAARMLAETRLLAQAFREYERCVRESGACDEHRLRTHLLEHAPSAPLRAVLVTVGDWIGDPSGLTLADYDLLTRMPGLEVIDILATETLLASGFHQRIHEWMPGIEEVDASALTTDAAGSNRPLLEVPAIGGDSPVFVYRDREEELIAAVRRIARGAPASRVAIVFTRPLPYLYLAPEVFRGAGLPFRAADALPLAAESAAAALDLVLEAVESGFTRASLVALLRSPHFRFQSGERVLSRDEISALDRALSERRFLGGADALTALSQDWRDDLSLRALQIGTALVDQLRPLADEAPASVQFMRVAAFLSAYQRPTEAGDDVGLRLDRGRAAIHNVLTALASAHAAYDDRPMAVADLVLAIRRAIEGQTFAPDARGDGAELVDEQAARYGEFDRIAIVGLIEGEWPERPRRNIFYPTSLLASMGWPTEQDRRAAVEARFIELLASAREGVTVSTVTLDDEALVEISTIADAIPRARLSAIEPEKRPATPLFRDEQLMASPVAADTLEPESQTWLKRRQSRSPSTDDRFHGQIDPGVSRTWSVSSLETYLGCPFRFFAQHVLRLKEEPEDEEVMDPRTHGEFVHGVFETFFRRWQAAGHNEITQTSLPAARALFAEVVDDHLNTLSPTEAALERTRLLGSPAAAGLGEAVFRMEVDRPVPVVERLLEHALKGRFVMETSSGPRTVPLSGKADRIDLLADGTFRVIDYKLGWPPNRARALQLPIYARCAEQALDGHRGRRWTLGEAAYVAFKGPRRVVPVIQATASAQERQKTLADAQDRLLSTIDAIEAGLFPPTPDDVFRCETCAYSAVCRLDYVGDV